MDEVNVVVRGVRRGKLELKVRGETTVREIKERVGRKEDLQVGRIRLVYMGRILQDWESVKGAGILEGVVLQAVIRPEVVSSHPHPSRNPHRSPISTSLRLECAYQNLHTIESLLPLSTHSIVKRHFSVGQWIDSQDSTSQWLEGQVRDVRGNRVLVHYLGWPQNWDEWMEDDSQRLQFFRLKTLQSHSAPTHSPYPTMTIDAFTWMRISPLDVSDLLLETIDLLTRLEPILNRWHDTDQGSLAVLSSPEVLDSSDDGSVLDRFTSISECGRPNTEETPCSEWLGVVLDRVGRLLSDLGIMTSRGNGLTPLPAPRDLQRLYNQY